MRVDLRLALALWLLAPAVVAQQGPIKTLAGAGDLSGFMPSAERHVRVCVIGLTVSCIGL